ncbi:hypothetical protein glysoja_000341 [Glycine soja]|nr:hypothetical protein glysoja_000341 [Glycine soja]
MTMALSSLFGSTRFIPTPFVTSTRNIPSSAHTCASNNKREFPLPPVASVPYQPINNFAYLQEEFSGHAGVTFEGVEDSCVAKMELKNGSIVTMMMPKGEYGDAIIQGGVSLNFNFQTHDDGEFSWSPTNWLLHKIQGNANEYIQVELTNRTSDDKIGLKYIVTLEQDALNSELEISNKKSLPVQMTGSILSHLTVSSPEATYALGLERSNYCSKPLFESEFMLSPPDSCQEEGFGKILQQFFPHWGTKGQNNGSEGGQHEEMDGRRNSVSVGRNGFDEMYLFSPGSEVEIYSKYSCICVGQAAILKPIILSPEGGQYIHNPNLDA